MTALIRQMESEGAYPAAASEQRQLARDVFAVHSDVSSGGSLHTFMDGDGLSLCFDLIGVCIHLHIHPQRGLFSNARARVPHMRCSRRSSSRTCCRASPRRTPSVLRTHGEAQRKRLMAKGWLIAWAVEPSTILCSCSSPALPLPPLKYTYIGQGRAATGHGRVR